MKNKESKQREFLTNKQINANEMKEGKTILESNFTSLICTLTSRCNIQCIMCGIWEDKWDIPGKTMQEIMDIVHYLEHAIWLGGEVFLSPYFAELLQETEKYPYLQQRINTNGLLIDESWGEKLLSNNIDLICSIDATSKDTYEHIRRGGKYEDLIRALRLINEMKKTKKNRKFVLRLNMVVMRSNYKELKDIIPFAYKYGFKNVQLIAIAGTENPQQIFSGKEKDKKIVEEIKGILPELYIKARDYGIDLFNCLPISAEESEMHDPPKTNYDEESPYGEMKKSPLTMFLDKKHLNKTAEYIKEINCDLNKMENNFCRLPWQQLLIEPEKSSFGCWCPKSIGNINDMSISEIWNSNVAVAYRNAIKNGTEDGICGERCCKDQIPAELKRVDEFNKLYEEFIA